MTPDLDICPLHYIAFASDLDHWIEPVVSGYRVTVTYHLYKAEGQATLPSTSLPVPALDTEAIRQMYELKASGELDGSLVLFPVVHWYSERSGADVVLKGGDALLFKTLEELGVKPKVMFYYDDSDDDYEKQKVCEGDDIYETLCYLTDVAQDYTEAGFCEDNPLDELADQESAIWARPPVLDSFHLSVAGYYGNEHGLVSYEGNLCIQTKW
jgi:hypothetical protein